MASSSSSVGSPHSSSVPTPGGSPLPPRTTNPVIIKQKTEKIAAKARLALADGATDAQKAAFHQKFTKYGTTLDIPDLRAALEGKLNDTEKQKLRALLAPPGSTGASQNPPMSKKERKQLAHLQQQQQDKLDSEKMSRTTKRVALIAGIVLFAIGVAISASGWGAIAGVPLALIGLGIAVYFNKEEVKKFGLMAGAGIAAGGRAVGKGTVVAGKAVVGASAFIWERIKKVLEKDKLPPPSTSTPPPSVSPPSTSTPPPSVSQPSTWGNAPPPPPMGDAPPPPLSSHHTTPAGERDDYMPPLPTAPAPLP